MHLYTSTDPLPKIWVCMSTQLLENQRKQPDFLTEFFTSTTCSLRSAEQHKCMNRKSTNLRFPTKVLFHFEGWGGILMNIVERGALQFPASFRREMYGRYGADVEAWANIGSKTPSTGKHVCMHPTHASKIATTWTFNLARGLTTCSLQGIFCLLAPLIHPTSYLRKSTKLFGIFELVRPDANGIEGFL